MSPDYGSPRNNPAEQTKLVQRFLAHWVQRIILCWDCFLRSIQRWRSLWAWCRAPDPTSSAESPPLPLSSAEPSFQVGKRGRCPLTLLLTKPHLMLPRAWITRGFFCFFFLAAFSSTTNLESKFLLLTLLETYLMPGALAMISSLIALLNLIFAFFLSARISLYLHRKRINKLESPLNLFLKSTIQVVNRLRGEGATLVLNKKDEGFFPWN